MVRTMPTTPTKDLATLALGTDVADWIVSRRPTPDAPPSYRAIAKELYAATGGRVDVTDETIRNWYVETLKAKHGACPHCTVPAWHNGDPCPNEPVEAAS